MAGAAQDTTYRVEPVEAYAGEEKLETSGASVTLTYNPFEDIAQHWAKEEILKAYHAGLFQGVSATRFAPESAIDRAMFVTVLYRLAGSPEVETVKTDFTDVDTGRYYAEAVAWAVETGVTNGVGEDRFAPHSAISRQDLVTMLYRYAQATGQDVTGQADLSGYVDAAGISGYAKEAMAWAVEEEISGGGDLLPLWAAVRGGTVNETNETRPFPPVGFVYGCDPGPCLRVGCGKPAPGDAGERFPSSGGPGGAGS